MECCKSKTMNSINQWPVCVNQSEWTESRPPAPGHLWLSVAEWTLTVQGHLWLFSPTGNQLNARQPPAPVGVRCKLVKWCFLAVMLSDTSLENNMPDRIRHLGRRTIQCVALVAGENHKKRKTDNKSLTVPC